MLGCGKQFNVSSVAPLSTCCEVMHRLFGAWFLLGAEHLQLVGMHIWQFEHVCLHAGVVK